jgi:hypothetical protein
MKTNGNGAQSGRGDQEGCPAEVRAEKTQEGAVRAKLVKPAYLEQM